jgi:hypothetical protein
MNFCFPLIVFLFLISACQNNHGHRVEAENLTVFFEEKEDLELAKKVANYWMKNDFVGSEHQYIKLIKSEYNVQIYLIAREEKNVKTIPFKHRLELTNLQKQLATIDSTLQFEFVISDKNFNPLTLINQ